MPLALATRLGAEAVIAKLGEGRRATVDNLRLKTERRLLDQTGALRTM